MRKKSHISLARYLVRELSMDSLMKHRKAFCFGSILPDLNPGMIQNPHEYATSYEMLKGKIQSIAHNENSRFIKERVLWRQIGVVMHYLADYFTLPHNSFYEGNLKDHCQYEKQMKHWMRRYVRTPEAMMLFRQQRAAAKQLDSLEMLFAYIEAAHESYSRQSQIHTVEDDCRWILTVCTSVLFYFVNSGDTVLRSFLRLIGNFERLFGWFLLEHVACLQNIQKNCVFGKKSENLLWKRR